MPFEQGQSGNPAGRPKGSKNKASAQLKEMINNFLLENFEQVQRCFDQLKPKDKVKVFCDLMAFAVPKVKSMHDDELERLTDEQVDELFEKIKHEANKTVQDAEAET